jgi:hypothetical protein
MARFIVPILAFAAAVLVAMTLGSFAHYGLGVGRSAIRTDALAGAGLLIIILAGGMLQERK